MVGDIELRWIPGLGGSPGGVDLVSLDACGGVVMRAVTLEEAERICAERDDANGTNLTAQLEVLVPSRPLRRLPRRPGSWMGLAG